MVAEECAFDDVADKGLFVGVEAVDGFELEVEVGVWSAFVGVEDELVGGYNFTFSIGCSRPQIQE